MPDYPTGLVPPMCPSSFSILLLLHLPQRWNVAIAKVRFQILSSSHRDRDLSCNENLDLRADTLRISCRWNHVTARSILPQRQRAVQLAQAASRGVGWRRRFGLCLCSWLNFSIVRHLSSRGIWCVRQFLGLAHFSAVALV
jgi:hypothetical protein